MAEATLQVVIKGRDQLSGALAGVNKSLKTLGKVALGVGAAGVAAVGAAAFKATKDFASFQQGMNEVFTLMPNISGEAMGEMTDQVKDLATEFGVMPEEVVPALYQSISAGVPADNVFTFLETAQKAAAGGVTDLETAVDGISSTVNAYGEDIINAGEASDLMFTAVRLGKTTFEELSGSLADVNPLASGMGVNFGDVTAALATMTSQGTSTNVATTQLRSALQELGKQGTQVGDIFQETAGVSFTDFIAEGGNMVDAMGILEQASADTGVPIQDMFTNVRGGLAAMQLTGAGAESFAENLAEMEGAAGATDAAFERMNGGLQATFNRIKSTFKVALLDFAEAFGPLLEQAADFAEDALPKIGDVINNVVVPAVEEVVSFIQGFFSALQEGQDPINAAIDSFLTWTNVGENLSEGVFNIVMQISNLWNRIKALMAPIIEAVGRFVEWKDVLLGLGIAVGIAIAAIVGPLVIAAAKIGLIFAGLVAVIAVVRNAWENNWGGIQDKVRAVIAFIVPLVRDAVDNIRTFWAENGAAIIAGVQEAWGQVEEAINTAIIRVQTIIANALSAIETFWDQHGTTIIATILTAWTVIQATISSAIAVIRPAITQFVDNAREALASFGPAIEDLKSLWDSLKPVITVVAGIIGAVVLAAVAIAVGALQGLALAVGPVIEAFTGMVSLVANLLRSFVTGLTNTFKIIVALIKGDTDRAKEIWRENWDETLGIITQIGQNIKQVISGLVNAVVNFIAGLVAGVIGFFQNLSDALVGGSIIPDMVNAIVEFISGLVDSFIGLVSGLVGSVITLFGDMWNAVKEAFDTAKTELLEKATAIKDSILKAIDVASEFAAVGVNLITSLANALWNRATTYLKQKAQGVASLLPTWVKELLGIASESSVFAEIGRNVGTGLASGILGTEGEVKRAVGQLVGAAMVPSIGGSIPVSMGAGAARAGAVAAGSTLNMNVDARGAGPRERMQLQGSLRRGLREAGIQADLRRRVG